ncbi:MAG: AAA family ATPase [Ktedonobacteraceae bacterium]
MWAGPPASPPTASTAQVATQDNSPDQAPPVADVPATAAGHISRPADAERRQLTVMFCDLVDSTVLSGQLDPEDLREVIRAYQTTCAEVIQRFEGHIAQYLGDGLLVYFGYPQAHEDDAQRAVQTGLGLVEALATLNSRLGQEHDVRLAARVGIHTGLVVVGTMGGGGRQEQLALGDTPNIAARLQGLAAPDTVVISAATARLVEGFFTWHALGVQDLKGLPQPLQVYRVLHARGTQTRLDVAATRGLTPLVGRDAEVTLLLERWIQVKEGRGQVIVLSGEAGIGKSRLVQVLKEHVADAPHTRWECRCSPYYQHTALYPLSEFFHRALHWQGDDTPDAKLGKLEHALRQYALPLDETVPLMAALLSLPLPADRYPPLVLSPQRQRQQTLDTLVAILLVLAAQHPVLLIVEDLHWVDPTTVEWLHLVVDQVPTTALCLLLTYRPEFQPPWGFRAHVTPLTLTRLPQTQAEAMLTRIAGCKALPAELRQQIVVRTDGVPLFVEELTKMVLESGLLQEREDRYELAGPLPPLAIPTTLQDSLTARLDRLAGVKMVAQLGAVLGREFSYEMIQAVARIDEATLQFGLGQLVDAGLLYQWGHLPQATYLFKHALIQDTAYQSLLRSTRQQYHQHIAYVLMEQLPDTVEQQF